MAISRLHYPILTLLTLSTLSILYLYLPTIPQICQCPSTTNHPHPPSLSPKTFFPQTQEEQKDQTLLDEAHLTANGGFFMVRNSPTSKPHGYGVSMLHQSHCVDMLRAALLGLEHDHTLHFKRDGLREVDSLDTEHLVHCLDYIAQGIVCSADDTLEERVIDWENKVAVINGMGVVHRCRNATFVLDAVERSHSESLLLNRKIEVGETLGSLLLD